MTYPDCKNLVNLHQLTACKTREERVIFKKDVYSISQNLYNVISALA